VITPAFQEFWHCNDFPSDFSWFFLFVALFGLVPALFCLDPGQFRVCFDFHAVFAGGFRVKPVGRAGLSGQPMIRCFGLGFQLAVS